MPRDHESQESPNHGFRQEEQSGEEKAMSAQNRLIEPSQKSYDDPNMTSEFDFPDSSPNIFIPSIEPNEFSAFRHFSLTTRDLSQILESEHKCLLIVDDNPYNLFIMKELLQGVDASFEIKTALNGEEALKVVMDPNYLKTTEHTAPKSVFKVVFMDLHMPVLDGFQVTSMRLILKIDDRQAEGAGSLSQGLPLRHPSDRSVGDHKPVV